MSGPHPHGKQGSPLDSVLSLGLKVSYMILGKVLTLWASIFSSVKWG